MTTETLARLAFRNALDVVYYRTQSKDKRYSSHVERVGAWKCACVAEDRVRKYADDLIQHLQNKVSR